MPGRADHPDIEMAAAMKAKKLRFRHVPDIDVRYAGDWRSATHRENLPREVEPDVTYRDVEVRWHVQARLDHETGETQGRMEP